MEDKKKCSSKNHKKDAICYCHECDLYMCNQCLKSHSDLFEGHHKYELSKDKQNFFSCFCQKKNHKNELEYFCKDHNQLCCAACITKLKGNGKGQHTDCNICFIADIKDEKKAKLKENIKILEDYSNIIEQSLNELKKINEKIIENKEKIKKEVSNIFTKIRNALNNREDELLIEIDNKFENLFFKDDLIKLGEKLPNEIKTSLEKGKMIETEKNEIDKINIFINGCINIENNINNIKLIKDSIDKYKSAEIIINFLPKEEKEIDDLINKIKLFGKIEQNIKEQINDDLEERRKRRRKREQN